ncbi:hypothetical protein DDW11_04575 [Sulfolobus sp. SCGC AB-777_G06]|nr:hypothetical protein DDW11_04575 [Sulfolobus sp. SCGC AB-777_G06]
MNWGKILGMVGALAFILIYLNYITLTFHYGILQVENLKLLKNLNVSIAEVNSSAIIVRVNNPLNVSVIVCNIIGKYIVFGKPIVIPPQTTKNVTIQITNYQSLVNQIDNNDEYILIKLKIENTTLTSVNLV